MKTFVVLVAVAACVQAFTEEQIQKIRYIHRVCASQTGVSNELIAKARIGHYIDDPKLKAHLFCFSKKAGFQNDAGDLKVDVIRAKLNAELKDLDVTNRVIEECAIRKATPEDTAFEAMKCYQVNTPDNTSLV